MKNYNEGYLNFKALYNETCNVVRDISIEEDPEKRKELGDKLLNYVSVYHKQIMHVEKFIKVFGLHREFNKD